MRKPEFYTSSFGIIRNNEGKILMIKRKNTGFMDGYYGLPAGHGEGTETPTETMQREIREEVGLEVALEDLNLLNVTHRINKESDGTNRVTIDFYYEVFQYSGAPVNAEPEKSEGIYWIDWKNEEKIQFRETLKRIEKGDTFSEIDFRNQ